MASRGGGTFEAGLLRQEAFLALASVNYAVF
jgi:hypothetical protein